MDLQREWSAIFLQGVNFPPVLPNFADASQERYEKLLRLYRDLGVNLVRVNGVGFLEKECFYDLCDELGIMVWQDMPLSSSGVENLPPDDSVSIDNLSDIFRSYIARRQHHPSLMIWCGGNELQRKDSEGRSVPVGLEYPLLHRFSEIASENDPTRRFIPTTATGPRFFAEAQEFGKGVHWNVHGPWKLWSDMSAWEEYWRHDDALFRAETGAPGASPADIIRQYAGDLDPMPIDSSNDLWRRPIDWWVESDVFLKEFGRAPESLDEYVAWSQQRQAEALSIAVTACKSRFPRCGGILLWCGHDCFPCASNTSIIDFHGNPKPAAEALREIWREPKTRDFEREANR